MKRAIFLLTFVASLWFEMPLFASERARPTIDVVFALDTTGSMGGLIQGAKEKIWSIASTLAQGQPAPQIRIGLVGYRDRGDDYITTMHPLTEDLDALYAKLIAFQASGGGDGPESVNQALHEAINGFAWNTARDAFRVVFLVGDAPPHLDYQDDVHYKSSVQIALAKGIIINTIQCGADAQTQAIWKEIASLGEGKFFQVDQRGSVASVATPFDARLAALSSALESTKLYFGDHRVQDKARRRDEVARSIGKTAPASALASRAAWNASSAGKQNFEGEQELVAQVAEGKVSLAEIDEADLPRELKGKTGSEQASILKMKSEERQRIQKEIEELAQKRQTFIVNEMKKAGKYGDSLDSKLFSTIREQGAKKGVVYHDGPRL